MVFHLFPTHNFDLALKLDNTDVIQFFHTNSRVSPIHYSLNIPAVFPSAIEISLPTILIEVIEPLGETVVTVGNFVSRAIVELNMKTKMAKIHIPYVADPMITVTWMTADVLRNQVQLEARVPTWMTVTDVTLDWKCQSLLSCAVKSDVAVMLPLAGKAQLSNLNTLILSAAKSQLSLKSSLTTTEGLLAFVPPMEVTMAWANDQLLNNQIVATVKSETLGNFLDLTIDGKCKSSTKCAYKADVHGAVPMIGKYHMTNSLSYLLKLTDTKVSTSTSANFSGGLLSLLPPVKSSVSAHCDLTTLTLDGSSSTSISGRNFGVVVSNTKIVQVLY